MTCAIIEIVLLRTYVYLEVYIYAPYKVAIVSESSEMLMEVDLSYVSIVILFSANGHYQ